MQRNNDAWPEHLGSLEWQAQQGIFGRTLDSGPHATTLFYSVLLVAAPDTYMKRMAEFTCASLVAIDSARS